MLDLLKTFVTTICPMPDEELDRLAPHVAIREVPAGWRLASVGEECAQLAFIFRGLFKLDGLDMKGTPFIAAFAAENSPVSDYVSMIRGEPAQLSITAIEPSTIALVPYAAYREVLARPGPWQVFARLVVEEALVALARREQQFLTLAARERYLLFLEERRDLVARVARQDLAAYLGITPASFSRLAGQIQRERRARERGAE